MYILTTNDNFNPSNFVIHEFYGAETCFCWDVNKLAIFPYSNSNKNRPIELLTTPGNVQQVHSFSGRIFITCYPVGIYKISRDRELAVLSKSAIEIGTVFYEVLIPKDNYLFLDNKQNKSSKPLFHISSTKCFDEISVLHLKRETTDVHFRRALLKRQEHNENLCMIRNGKNLFVLANEIVQIVYNCDHSITAIMPLYNGEMIVGLILLISMDSIIIVHMQEHDLLFEKVNLKTKIGALCAGMCQKLQNVLWIVHSDNLKLYYTKKDLNKHANQARVKTEAKSLICLQVYNAEFIIGLSEDKQLIKMPIDMIESLMNYEYEEFIDLHSDMLQGTENIVDRICDKAKTLKVLNQTVLNEEDQLRRLNLYANKVKTQDYPAIRLQRISNEMYIFIKFLSTLPKNTKVAISFESKGQRIFCIKEVTNVDILIEMPIPHGKLSNCFSMIIDLITLTNEGRGWCLIRNVIRESSSTTHKSIAAQNNKINFINAKLMLLKRLMTQNILDIHKLSEIKKMIRNEIGYS